MANFCLPKPAVDKFTAALRSGKIDPYKLRDMTSEQRRAIFKDVVGENGAKQVNAEFEAKTLLKNQNLAYTNWAKKVAGITPETRRDLISKIQRLDHVLSPEEEKPFLQDLASQRLGVGVTQEEAKSISNLSHAVTEGEAKAKPDGTFSNEDERLNYGMAKVNLENYINDLKIASRNVKTKNPVKLTGKAIKGTPGFLKSSLSTFDNSFFGRQGIKTLLNVRTAPTWVKGFAKSWKDIGRELGGKHDVLDMIKADIYSRPNALNGKYKALGKNSGLQALTEEAYPSHAPEKIPLFGRLFKASEAAYNGGALRMRADLADRFIKAAEKQGVNTLNPDEAKGIGTLVSSMTGRGHLGSWEKNAKGINTYLFSPKFLKANIDTLTLHAFDKNATKFTRKEAAKNLAGIVGTVSAALTIAHTLDPKSVELDPRSTHFGKIKIFGHWTDITGGESSLVTLASRLVPTTHNGKIGLYSKSGSGAINQENTTKYGAQTGEDTFNNFWEGKAAPIPSTILQLWAGQDYNGNTPTAKSIAKGSLLPISVQNYSQLKDKGKADQLGSLIADGLGFSVTSNPQANKQNLPQAPPAVQSTLENANYTVPKASTSQRGKELNPQQYKQFTDNTNKNFVDAVNKARSDPAFQKYSAAQQKSSLSSSMTKARNKSLDSLHIPKVKNTKVKSY